MLLLSTCFVLSFALFTNAHSYNTVRIYSNLAEVIAPLEDLPLVFSHEDWTEIRTDSITLLGENVTITSQTITEKKVSLNGSTIYIRSPLSTDQTSIKLVQAILVDETTNLVKVQDESIAGDDTLYFTVPENHIFSLREPNKAKYSVNFTYTSPSDSPVFVSYLQSHLTWQTQYQLNLHEDTSDLIAMANIHNKGKLPVFMNQAELVGGNVNLQLHHVRDDEPVPQASMAMMMRTQPRFNEMVTGSSAFSTPSVKQGSELVGLYVFPIKSSLTIDAKTNYLMPMFQPHVTLERYAFISKTFSPQLIVGKAQRSYRLRSDRYLSKGSCIVREQDRIVGETMVPDLAAKDKYEFSIGEDANVVYKEIVTLTSTSNFNETEPTLKSSTNTHLSPAVIITLRTRSAYSINLEIKNFKDHAVNVEYEQNGFDNFRSFKMIKGNRTRFVQDGTTIKSNMTLNANSEEFYTYNVEVIS